MTIKSRERFPWEGRKQVWRQSQDGQRTKNLNQDERADTMRELSHKLWGEWGLPDERLNTCTGTATDTHRQVHGSLPTLRMNSVTSLSHSSFPSPPLLLSSTAQSKAGLSLQQCKPIFHPLTPPTHSPSLPLHFRNGCGNTSTDTQTASSLPRGAGDWLQTTA